MDLNEVNFQVCEDESVDIESNQRIKLTLVFELWILTGSRYWGLPTVRTLFASYPNGQHMLYQACYIRGEGVFAKMRTLASIVDYTVVDCKEEWFTSSR